MWIQEDSQIYRRHVPCRSLGRHLVLRLRQRWHAWVVRGFVVRSGADCSITSIPAKMKEMSDGDFEGMKGG